MTKQDVIKQAYQDLGINPENYEFDGTYDAVVSKQSILNAKSPIE